jgi:hypothetical protein
MGEGDDVGVGGESSGEAVGGEGSRLSRERPGEFDEGWFSLQSYDVVVGIGTNGEVKVDGESERDEGEDEEGEGGNPIELRSGKWRRHLCARRRG